jgi:hypothetical protein
MGVWVGAGVDLGFEFMRWIIAQLQGSGEPGWSQAICKKCLVSCSDLKLF